MYRGEHSDVLGWSVFLDYLYLSSHSDIVHERVKGNYNQNSNFLNISHEFHPALKST